MRKLYDYRVKDIFERKTFKPLSVDIFFHFAGKKRLWQDWLNVCCGTIASQVNDTSRKTFILRKVIARFIIFTAHTLIRLKQSKGNALTFSLSGGGLKQLKNLVCRCKVERAWGNFKLVTSFTKKGQRTIKIESNWWNSKAWLSSVIFHQPSLILIRIKI